MGIYFSEGYGLSESTSLGTANPVLGMKKAGIIGFCKAKLTKYKVPTVVEFRDSLPKSAVGKILRKILRREESARLKK